MFRMTTVHLERSAALNPIRVSLDVDSNVFLYSADIEPDSQARSRCLSRSRSANSASWTDLLLLEQGGPSITLDVNWVTVDSLSPGRAYQATVAILDSAGELAPVKPGSHNPMTIDRHIGPASNPTDTASVRITIG